MSIVVLDHESEVLRANGCGDPARRKLWVYVPPGYERGRQRYPVLWCLTGFTGAGEMAVVGNRWAPGLAERMDRLIAGGSPPAIVAFPDCFTRWGGSQYLNSPLLGRYEDYLCDELVPLVDREFRTLSVRGVFGKSSGGYGAIRLGMVRAETFHAVACHSGDMAFALCHLPDFGPAAATVAAAGSLEEWRRRFDACEKKRQGDLALLNTLAMGAAYSPDPRGPLGIALPFDLETGEIVAEVWQRWKAHDPVEMVLRPKCQAALRSLRLLYLDCGSEDQYRLHLGQRLFVKRLRELGIAHEAEEFKDDHSSISYRYDLSVPKLARALA